MSCSSLIYYLTRDKNYNGQSMGHILLSISSFIIIWCSAFIFGKHFKVRTEIQTWTLDDLWSALSLRKQSAEIIIVAAKPMELSLNEI